MKTEAPSPKSRLRLVWSQSHPRPVAVARSITAATWLGFDFRCGEMVREKGGRHIGRIEAIKWSTVAVVKFSDTGWKAEIPLSELEYVK
jgi:hypothetical protein